MSIGRGFAIAEIDCLLEIIEDGGAASASNSGGANVTATGQGRGTASGAGTPLVGARICTPHQAQAAGIGGNLSELMQFMLMCVEAENQAEQCRRQECEDLEDRHHRERERMQKIDIIVSVRKLKRGMNVEWKGS